MFLIVWLVRRLAVLALLLAIPVVVGELVARKLAGDAVKSQVKAAFGGSPSVDFGSTPLLEQLVEGHVSVNISDANAAIAGLPPVALTASFDDIRLTSLLGLHGVIGSVAATAGLGPVHVRDLLAASGCFGALPAGVDAALTARPRVKIAVGHISVLPPHGRAAVVRIVPSAVANRLDLSVVRVDLGGQAAADGSQPGCVASVGSLPFGLSLAAASATRGSLALTFRGSGARFSG
jgi:hypothetical protein